MPFYDSLPPSLIILSPFSSPSLSLSPSPSFLTLSLSLFSHSLSLTPSLSTLPPSLSLSPSLSSSLSTSPLPHSHRPPLPPPTFLPQQIIDYTPEDHMDYDELKGGLEEAQRLCNSVNEAVRLKENTEQLEWLQSNVQFSLDEVTYMHALVDSALYDTSSATPFLFFVLLPPSLPLSLTISPCFPLSLIPLSLPLYPPLSFSSSLSPSLSPSLLLPLSVLEPSVQFADQFHGAEKTSSLGKTVQGQRSSKLSQLITTSSFISLSCD